MAEKDWQLVADDLCCVEAGSDAAALAEVARRTHDWIDVVCGRGIVTVQFDPTQVDVEQALGQLRALEPPSHVHESLIEPLVIPACYDAAVAPDLVETCEQLGLTVDQFIEAHSSTTHTVAMLGFMPGFAYVDGLDASLKVERLDQPRQQIAAGSIGIAGRQTGLYPFDGPGGWRLVARTPLVLFDPRKTPPALLQPMQEVRFVPITLEQFEAHA